jgi:hypothetical protein
LDRLPLEARSETVQTAIRAHASMIYGKVSGHEDGFQEATRLSALILEK